MQRTKCLHLASGGRGAKDYLKFTAQEASTIALVKVGNTVDVSLVTSLNGAPWQAYTTGNTISLNEGDELRMRAATVNNNLASNANNYHNFVMTGKVAASGDLQSLFDSTLHNRVAANMRFLFQNCTSLVVPPYSSATTWTGENDGLYKGSGIVRAMKMTALYCNRSSFYEWYKNCTALVDASPMDCTQVQPQLPTGLHSTFSGMCYGCTAMISPPKITIDNNTAQMYYCFTSAFRGCTALVDASDIKLVNCVYGGSAFRSMFEGCSSLVVPPIFGNLARTSTYGYEFRSCFDSCTSLVTAPTIDLDADAQYCFWNCTSLVDASGITLRDAPVQSGAPAKRVFQGCTSLRVPPKIKCQGNGVGIAFYECFRGCAALEYAEIEDFTGASWANNQFAYMFYGCTSLQRLKVHFEQWGDGVNGTTNWLQNAAAAATFECPATLDQTQRDNSHIPSGWTIETF